MIVMSILPRRVIVAIILPVLIVGLLSVFALVVMGVLQGRPFAMYAAGGVLGALIILAGLTTFTVHRRPTSAKP